MNKIPSLLAFTFLALAVNAQTGSSIDVAEPSGTNGYGSVRISNPSALGSKATADIKDDDVAGTPYFSDKWNAAIIVSSNNTAAKVNKARLNCYTGQLHYIDELGIELVADPSLVKKIYFLDGKDTMKTAAVFQQVTGLQDKAPTTFVQVLNSGKVALLKLTRVILNDQGFNTLKGKNDYSFQRKETYYVANNGVVNPVKTLNKDAVTAVAPPNTVLEKWLVATKNKLKTEADVISFFEHYNAED